MTRSKKPAHQKLPFLGYHIKALHDSKQQLRSTPLITLATCTVIAITLVFTCLLFLGLGVFQHIAEGIHTNNEVTIYLKSTSTDQQIQTWMQALRENSLIREVTYISPEQGLKDLAEEPGYDGVLDNTSENPLPPVLLVKFQEADKTPVITAINQFRAMPLVETVHLNFEWFDRLFALLKLAHRVTYVLATLLSFGVIFVISYAILAATQRNQQEMALLELIGAKKPYLRRPFLYLGALLGVGSGIITLILLATLFLFIQNPIEELLTSYNLAMTGPSLTMDIAFSILGFSAALGYLGAWIAFYRYSKTSNNY